MPDCAGSARSVRLCVWKNVNQSKRHDPSHHNPLLYRQYVGRRRLSSSDLTGDPSRHSREVEPGLSILQSMALMNTEDNPQIGQASSPAASRRRVIMTLILTVVSAVGLVIVLRHTDRPRVAESANEKSATTTSQSHVETSQNRLISDAPVVSNPGYVGPDVCAQCHYERVSNFKHTGHYRTCREPDPETMTHGFADDQGSFKTRYDGLRFEMSRSGSDFIQTSIRQTEDGEERTSRKIDLVYGAGTADEIYLAWHDDGRMYELPMAWLYTHDQWAAEYFDPYGSGDYSRPLTVRCLECHNTWFEYIPGSVNKYRRDNFIMGVTCERCHGPGQEHVAYHQEHPDDMQAHAIVSPQRLSRERQIEVCTQCHSNAMKHLGPSLSYRPGEPLDAFYKTLISRRSDEDHVANQIQYLRQSDCFSKSDSMTCTTCHNPHEAKSAINSGSVTCFQCHAHQDCGEQATLPEPLRNQCVECHMPSRIKINVNFQTEDDVFQAVIRRHEHRIAVDLMARDEVLFNWLREQPDLDKQSASEQLQASLVARWLNSADEQRQELRFFAAIASVREALAINDSPEVRAALDELIAIQSKIYSDWDLAIHQTEANQTEAAITTLRSLIELQPNHAPAIGKLGALLASTGQRDKAEQLLKEVSEKDPNDPYGHAMLGWLDYLDNRSEEALEHYFNAEQVEPYSAKLLHQIGLVYLEFEQSAEAIRYFNRSFEIDPGNSANAQFLCMALYQNGLSSQAIDFIGQNEYLPQEERVNILKTLQRQLANSGDLSLVPTIDKEIERITRGSKTDDR